MDHERASPHWRVQDKRRAWLDICLIQHTAAGTGDVLYVNTQEILAVEIRSENGGVFLVLKDGKVIPVAEDYHAIIGRLETYNIQVEHDG